MANTKVQSEQIADGAITAAKIADGAIVASEVADNAITTAKINADAVTGAKIADNAINSEHYTDGSIDTAHIADSQVTSAKIDTNIDIAGTFDVTGATTLDSTLAVAGAATLTTAGAAAEMVNIVSTHASGIPILTLKGAHSAQVRYQDENGNNQARIDFNDGGQFKFIDATDGSTKLEIDSNGKFSVGGATPQGNLTIKGASSDDIDLLTFSEDGTNQSFSFNGNFAGSGSTGNNLTLDSYWTNDIITFGGDGKVGIGTASPTELLEVFSESASTAIEISAGKASTTTGEAKLVLRSLHSSSGTTYSRSEIASLATAGGDSDLIFRTTTASGGPAEHMRITDDGNVLVGTTDVDLGFTDGDSGVVLNPDGYIQAARDSAFSILYLNKLNNDGALIDFHKDGAKVGSIGTSSSDLTIFSTTASHVGLQFGNTRLHPTDNAGSTTDGVADLGFSTTRWKDLYLSGSAYLGGTAAANALDDYEEGTWTPAVIQGSVTASSANYTKTGRTVVLSCVLSNFTNDTSTAAVTISGLPFASKSASIAVGSMLIRGTNRTGVLTITPFLSASSSQMTFYLSYENSTAYAPLQHDHFTSTTADILADITYTTS